MTYKAHKCFPQSYPHATHSFISLLVKWWHVYSSSSLRRRDRFFPHEKFGARKQTHTIYVAFHLRRRDTTERDNLASFWNFPRLSSEDRSISRLSERRETSFVVLAWSDRFRVSSHYTREEKKLIAIILKSFISIRTKLSALSRRKKKNKNVFHWKIAGRIIKYLVSHRNSCSISSIIAVSTWVALKLVFFFGSRRKRSTRKMNRNEKTKIILS